MNVEIRNKAREIANEMRDDCDGSYVGSESKEVVKIEGKDVELSVVAFWEKSFWFEYSAKGDGVDVSDTVYS